MIFDKPIDEDGPLPPVGDKLCEKVAKHSSGLRRIRVRHIVDENKLGNVNGLKFDTQPGIDCSHESEDLGEILVRMMQQYVEEREYAPEERPEFLWFRINLHNYAKPKNRSNGQIDYKYLLDDQFASESVIDPMSREMDPRDMVISLLTGHIDVLKDHERRLFNFVAKQNLTLLNKTTAVDNNLVNMTSFFGQYLITLLNQFQAVQQDQFNTRKLDIEAQADADKFDKLLEKMGPAAKTAMKGLGVYLKAKARKPGDPPIVADPDDDDDDDDDDTEHPISEIANAFGEALGPDQWFAIMSLGFTEETMAAFRGLLACKTDHEAEVYWSAVDDGMSPEQFIDLASAMTEEQTGMFLMVKEMIERRAAEAAAAATAES